MMVREAELARVVTRVARYKTNYDTLYARYHDMRIADEMKTERFAVDQRASVGAKPAWPNPSRILLVGVVAGLGSGFGLAFGLQFLDNKIQTIKDVEERLKIRFLGGIPYWVHSGLERSVRPIVTEEHSTGAIEAYRALRTTVTTELTKMNEKTVFITSADSREGKTLTSLNLAIITAQMNKKVLLMDFDLRRGRLHRSLGVEKEPGVSDALKEGRSFREVVQPSRIENLDLAPAGSNISDSAELLQQTNLLGMLVEMQDYYDYIIVDTSPVLRVTDTVIVATQGIGAVVYVARVNHTPKPLIKYSLEMLREANVIGLIMNSIEMHKISSLYYTYQYPNYAYYSNAYAYGYNYYHYGEQQGQRGRYRRPAALQNARRSLSKWFRDTFLPME
jgi:capsular exopolysaccharide synthesis family protein